MQFPGYGVLHDDHTLWLMHQHRAAYELYDEARATPDERRLRDRIRAFDDRMIGRIGHRFANSGRVAERLRHCNGLEAEPLYHPPYNADRFCCKPAYDYIFFPSRLETLKRQDLLIEAARMTRSPVGFLIAGTGGQQPRYRRLIETHGLGGTRYACSDRSARRRSWPTTPVVAPFSSVRATKTTAMSPWRPCSPRSR